MIVAAAVIPVTYHSLPGRSEKVAQDKLIAQADAELAEANMVRTHLSREVTLLSNDGDYLAVFARDRVDQGYMKAGETVFRLTPQR